jgi:hypothetical protein
LETDTSDAVLGLESCGVFLEDPTPAGNKNLYHYQMVIAKLLIEMVMKFCVRGIIIKMDEQ